MSGASSATGAFIELRVWVTHYVEQLMTGASIKVFFASVLTFFTNVLYGDKVVFMIYLAFALLDLVLGVTKAIVYDSFNPKYLLYWVKKLGTHMLLILLLGLLCNAFFHTSGVTVSFVNWMLFICSTTELASIIWNLKSLGMPVPPVVDVFLKVLRKRASSHIAQCFGDDEMRQEIEKALQQYKSCNDCSGCGRHPHE